MDFNSVPKRESIVLNAIDLIHEFGIHLVSTKEIAKRLGISESTVFKYFPKEKPHISGSFRAVLVIRSGHIPYFFRKSKTIIS